MTAPVKTTLALLGLTGTFLALAAAFALDPWGHPAPLPPPNVAPASLNGATVRISAEALIKSGEDASALKCYACHDEKKVPEIHFDAQHRVILPPEHADLIYAMRNCKACHADTPDYQIKTNDDGDTIIPEAHAADKIMSHGPAHRNSRCYNCHNPNKLDELLTDEGIHLKLTEGTRLCISCHGTSGRDWEAGSHGRTTGHWDRTAGPQVREGCTSCHDPHSPHFPQMPPLRGPARLDPPHANAATAHP